MKSLYKIEMDIRWGDLDAFNHVNNTGYLRFIEEARVTWFKSLVDNWADADCAPILAAIQNNYKKPISWPEKIHVELFCEHIGTKSLKLAHRITSTSDADIVYADGHTIMVWVNATSGSTVPLPENVLNACKD
jgi:acyl-CoA thioester hydrolase